MIVCDDGPTDGIDAAIESYGDRLIYLRRTRGSRFSLERGAGGRGGRVETQAVQRSLAAQRNALVLTEAEAALRSRARDARSRALAAARSLGVSFRARASAVAASIALRAAGRLLERRAEDGALPPRPVGASRLKLQAALTTPVYAPLTSCYEEIACVDGVTTGSSGRASAATS